MSITIPAPRPELTYFDDRDDKNKPKAAKKKGTVPVFFITADISTIEKVSLPEAKPKIIPAIPTDSTTKKTAHRATSTFEK